MTDEQWFKQFDDTQGKFAWFIRMVGNSWGFLVLAREIENRSKMMEIMNHVWFVLPDHRFNIIENPPGWSEFLALIEE